MSSPRVPAQTDFDSTIASEMPRKKKQDLGFGPRLTAIRKARGLTQVQLAKTAATTQRFPTMKPTTACRRPRP